MLAAIATVVLSALGSAAVTGMVIWLARVVILERLRASIKDEYDRAFTVFSSKIKSENDSKQEELKGRIVLDNTSSLERLKHLLQIHSAEHQFRFSKLHEKIVEVVHQSHALLSDQVVLAGDYIKMIDQGNELSQAERRAAFSDGLNKTRTYLRHHRIYFKEDLAKQIEDLAGKLDKIAYNFMWNVELPILKNIETTKAWGDAVKEFVDEAIPLMKTLENEFRRLIGVELDVMLSTIDQL